jgi:hypothetical protein
MEHVTITNLGNEIVRLTPDNGYQLYDDRTQRTYSDAVVKESDVKHFRAVKI